MAINKEDKGAILAVYQEVLSRTQGLVVAEYRGMTMKQFNDVRKSLREVNAAFVVTKLTLFKIALEQAGMAVPDDLLVGPHNWKWSRPCPRWTMPAPDWSVLSLHQFRRCSVCSNNPLPSLWRCCKPIRTRTNLPRLVNRLPEYRS